MDTWQGSLYYSNEVSSPPAQFDDILLIKRGHSRRHAARSPNKQQLDDSSDRVIAQTSVLLLRNGGGQLSMQDEALIQSELDIRNVSGNFQTLDVEASKRCRLEKQQSGETTSFPTQLNINEATTVNLLPVYVNQQEGRRGSVGGGSDSLRSAVSSISTTKNTSVLMITKKVLMPRLHNEFDRLSPLLTGDDKIHLRTSSSSSTSSPTGRRQVIVVKKSAAGVQLHLRPQQIESEHPSVIIHRRPFVEHLISQSKRDHSREESDQRRSRRGKTEGEEKNTSHSPKDPGKQRHFLQSLLGSASEYSLRLPMIGATAGGRQLHQPTAALPTATAQNDSESESNITLLPQQMNEEEQTIIQELSHSSSFHSESNSNDDSFFSSSQSSPQQQETSVLKHPPPHHLTVNQSEKLKWQQPKQWHIQKGQMERNAMSSTKLDSLADLSASAAAPSTFYYQQQLRQSQFNRFNVQSVRSNSGDVLHRASFRRHNNKNMSGSALTKTSQNNSSHSGHLQQQRIKEAYFNSRIDLSTSHRKSPSPRDSTATALSSYLNNRCAIDRLYEDGGGIDESSSSFLTNDEDHRSHLKLHTLMTNQSPPSKKHPEPLEVRWQTAESIAKVRELEVQKEASLAALIEQRKHVTPIYEKNYEKKQKQLHAKNFPHKHLLETCFEVECQYDRIRQSLLEAFSERVNLVELVEEFSLMPPAEYIGEIMRFLKFAVGQARQEDDDLKQKQQMQQQLLSPSYRKLQKKSTSSPPPQFQVVPKIVLDWLVNELQTIIKGIFPTRYCDDFIAFFLKTAIQHLLPQNLYQELGSEIGIIFFIKAVINKLNLQLDIHPELLQMFDGINSSPSHHTSRDFLNPTTMLGKVFGMVLPLIQNDFSLIEARLIVEDVRLTSVEFYLIKSVIFEIFRSAIKQTASLSSAPSRRQSEKSLFQLTHKHSPTLSPKNNSKSTSKSKSRASKDAAAASINRLSTNRRSLFPRMSKLSPLLEKLRVFNPRNASVTTGGSFTQHINNRKSSVFISSKNSPQPQRSSLKHHEGLFFQASSKWKSQALQLLLKKDQLKSDYHQLSSSSSSSGSGGSSSELSPTPPRITTLPRVSFKPRASVLMKTALSPSNFQRNRSSLTSMSPYSKGASSTPKGVQMFVPPSPLILRLQKTPSSQKTPMLQSSAAISINSQAQISNNVTTAVMKKHRLFSADNGIVSEYTRNEILQKIEVTRCIVLQQGKGLAEVIQPVASMLFGEREFLKKRKPAHQQLQQIEVFLRELSLTMFLTKERRQVFLTQTQKQNVEAFDVSFWHIICKTFVGVLARPDHKFINSPTFIIDLKLRFYYLQIDALLFKKDFFSMVPDVKALINNLFLWVENEHYGVEESTPHEISIKPHSTGPNDLPADLLALFDRRFMTFFLEEALVYGAYSAMDTDYAIKYYKIQQNVLDHWMRGLKHALNCITELSNQEKTDLLAFITALLP